LEFGLIFAIIGIVFFLVLLYKPASIRQSNPPLYVRLWEVSVGCLAAGGALIWAGFR
jgi:hypothetical protein